MGTKPDAHHFPRRNRIISGLALGTMIVESLEDGGAMITATTSLDQNREVFAVPGNIFEKRSSGPHKLLREGRATLIRSIDDIVEELHVKLRPILNRDKKPRSLPPLTLFEQTIHGLLGEDPLHIDLISDRAQLSTPDTLVSLLSLEFKGLVKQLPGKMFLRM
jgi:DNA processing protein